MRRRILSLCLLLGLAAALALGAQAAREGQVLAGSLVRLHVIAASDSERDQQVKLQVRDAVLNALPELPEDCGAEGAVSVLRAALPELARAASDALEQAGEEERVTVRLCTEQYPERDYGTFALPAGEYVSLQVRIGAAAGHNWWCVVYPNLCRAASTDVFRMEAEAAGLSSGQMRLMMVDSGSVQFRFRFLELLQKLRALF